jgi:GNAT superfamily N-acetyltransferase
VSSDVLIRPYRPEDYAAGRQLWAQLTEHHRRIYDDPSIGGADPGAYFDTYLATPERIGSWVAEADGEVVGLTGLFDRGDSGEVEPMVVAADHRGSGVGQALFNHVRAEADRHPWDYLTIRPVARNTTAISSFHRWGFDTLGGHVDLSLDLRSRRHRWLSPANLHGLDFRY